MLELGPDCECCGIHLLADRDTVWICSLECAFCAACAQRGLQSVCPNCAGQLTPRSRRAHWLREKFPASARLVPQSGHCDAALTKHKRAS